MRSVGSGDGEPISTTLPNLLPFSVAGSATAATCSKTVARVDACPRAKARPAPSAELTMSMPVGDRNSAAAV